MLRRVTGMKRNHARPAVPVHARRAHVGEDPVGNPRRLADDHQPLRARVRDRVPGRPASAQRDAAVPAACLTLLGFMAVFAAVYLAGYFDLQNHAGAELLGEGPGLVDGALRVPDLRRRPPRPGAAGSCSCEGWKWFTGGLLLNCVYGLLQLVLQVGAGINLDKLVVGPAHRRPGRRRRHQRLRPGERLAEHLPRQRADRRPQPPRRDAVRAAAACSCPCLPARAAGAPADGLDAAVHVRRADPDAVALGRPRGPRGPDGAVPGAPPSPAAGCARWRWC